jgi:periplasmic protein TonB
MRLTLSLLAAIGLHGALFGVAAALLSPAPTKAGLPVAIDVEVIPAQPDPIADGATGPAAPAPHPAPAPSRRHVTPRLRDVASGIASVDRSSPASATLAAPPAPAEASAALTPAPPVSPVRTSTNVTPQGGGTVVSAQPRYHTNPKPDYPIPSLRRREEGIVLLNVQVQADGRPAAISLDRSCGHPLLDRAALDAVRRWTFEPARAAGVPVSSLVVIPVRFSLTEQP